MKFRDLLFQSTAVKEIADLFFNRNYKRILLCSPTGSGKTYIASDFLRLYLGNGLALFIVNKQALVGQAYETCLDIGLRPAVLHNTITHTKSGIRMNDDIQDCNVIITLVETHDNLVGSIPQGIDPTFIILDEAHKATSKSFQELVDTYSEALVLGLTATPGRGVNKEGEALSEFYQTMVTTISVAELINQKVLAEPFYINKHPDDHVVNSWLEITKQMNDANPMKGLVPDNRRTIVFTDDTGHSLQLLKSFRDAGISAAIITAGSEKYEEAKFQTPNQRNQIFRDFQSGVIEVLISVNALCEGFDEPLTAFCFLCRKVGHVALYQQMVGRTIRGSDAKYMGFIVDFQGNIDTYGKIEDFVWNLDDEVANSSKLVKGGDTISAEVARKKKLHVCCQGCGHVYDYEAEDFCVHCKSVNKIYIKMRVEKARDFLIDQLEPETWEHLINHPSIKTEKDAFWKVVEILDRCLNNHAMRAKFNVLYFEAFEYGTLELKRKYRWLRGLHTKKKKLKMVDYITSEL